MVKALSTFGKGKKLNGLNAVKVGLRLIKHSLRYPLHRHFGFPKVLPKYGRISVTDMCDSRCNMCNIWTKHRVTLSNGRFPRAEDFIDTPILRSEMSFEEFKRFVDKNPFSEDLMLTGGQTTLKKDIIQYWLYLDKKGYRTGGPLNTVDVEEVIRIQSELLESLSGRQTHSIAVSIDGFGEIHDRIRGTTNGFNDSVRFLKWAQKQQQKYPFFDVSISHNLTPDNYTDFPRFVDYFVKLGFKPNQITFRPTQDFARFSIKSASARQVISDKDFSIKKDLLKVLNHMRRKYPEYDDYYVRGIREFYYSPHKQVIPCYAGYNSYFIDPYWNVYPCAPEMNEQFKIGNLREVDFCLERLWNTKKIRTIHRKIRENKCVNCWTRCHSAQSIMANPIKLLNVFKDNLWRLF